MFILIFFLVISISQFVSNKMINLSDDSEDAYTFTKKDSLIIVILLVVGIVLQIVSKMLLTSFYWVAAGIYLFASLILMLIILQTRKTQLLQQREQLQQVYDILQKLVDKKGEGLDFNNPPFTLDYKYGNVQRIVVPVDPVALADVKDLTSAMVPYMTQLDNFLPTYKWAFDKHLEQRYIEFIGEDKPPERAKWPGSWLRNFRFMPVGISGKGEVGFMADDYPSSQVGRSLYKNEEGEYLAIDKTLPKQPQALVCGAPLGLNTIIPTTKGYKTMEIIEVGDEVFDVNNKPVKVLGKSEINYNPEKVYKLLFNSLTENSTPIEVISDGVHKFPLAETRLKWIITSAEDLTVGRAIMGNAEPFRNIGYVFKHGIYAIQGKEEIKKQPVQCILVDSDEHLFLITDESHMYEEWEGGDSYPYEAVYTRNTGGGKSVYIQNIIMSCIEHRNKVATALVDPKQVEFSSYNGMNGILGVANSTLEAVEILRIARSVMHKRNKDLKELGLKNVGEFTPTKKSGKVYITGKEVPENEMIKVRIDGEERQMRASELVEYLQEE